MLWHNGNNRKKYLAFRERQRDAWRRAGMTEAQIEALEEFDEEVYRSDRRFYEHNGGLHEDEDPGLAPEPAVPEADGLPAGVRLGWRQEIGDPDLLALLKKQPPETLRLVELLVFEGYSQQEAARLLGCSTRTLSCRWQRFRKEAATFLERRAQRRRAEGQPQGPEKAGAALREGERPPEGSAGCARQETGAAEDAALRAGERE